MLLGDLVNKELLMVGDFDCLSVVAALTGLPKRVVVVEYDDRLVNFINEVASELNLNLKAQKFDVRMAFPDDLEKSFDVFSCDPVETLEGIKLYIARGVTGLKGIGCSGYIGLTSLEASKKKWFDIEKIFLDMNFAITDLRRNFNAYPDTGLEEMHPFYKKIGIAPDCTWYWAALVRIEAIDTPNIPVLGPYMGSADIYVDDEAWATPQ
jgi:predicted methyltransferase